MIGRRLIGAVAVAGAVIGGLAAGLGRADDRTAAGADESLREAMAAALQDEWRAEAFYAAVMEVHGEVRPFSRIVHAEDRHAAALLALYGRLGMDPPANGWADHAFEVPATLEACCDLAAVSEILNVAIYDEWLERIEHEDARRVFGSLRDASAERHLRAFRRCGSGWEAVDVEAMDETTKRQKATAEVAQRELFSKIFSALRRGMAEGGLASAIEACHVEAPGIPGEVADARGVRIGRTSFKLRNPENGPPVWAIPYVEERVERSRFLKARDGRLAALLPIRTMTLCLGCHGEPERIDPAVRERLAELYPEDEATGFGENELRGWFWVEVPPPVGD